LIKKIHELDYQQQLAMGRRQNAFHHIISLLTEQLKSGIIVAKGYDQHTLQWVSPSPSDWKYLTVSEFLMFPSGGFSISIIGGLSGETHLDWVMFGKPLGGQSQQ
jgi:hypothetical protein